MKALSIATLTAFTTLAACGPTDTADPPNVVCARADIKDTVLDSVARSFTQRSGNFLVLFDESGTLSEALVEEFKGRSSLENVRGTVASSQQWDCTVDVVTTNSAKDPTPVEFRGVRFSLVQQQDGSLQIVPLKSSFFSDVRINGMPKGQWDAQQANAEQNQAALNSPTEQIPTDQQGAAQAAQEAADAAAGAERSASEAAEEASRASEVFDGPT